MNMAVRMVEEANTEGNRTEIILLETAKAIAAFDKRSYLNFEDMKEAAAYVLVHRRRKEQKTEEFLKRRFEETEKERTTEEAQNLGERQGMAREQEFIQSKEEETTFSIGDTFAVKEWIHKKTLHLKKRRGSRKCLKTTISLKMHLNLSLSGKYVREAIHTYRNKNYSTEEIMKGIYQHIGNIDYHDAFDEESIMDVIQSLPLRYLVYELIVYSKKELEEKIQRQDRSLEKLFI
ncbi:MAG TPA: hypothetical protein VIG61_01675 [Fusobacterium sp.]|uniref:hypothetical protein n=1 Tax=Fusobacterium sp. TaxID=68766 RepID=UPI002F3EC439